MSFPAIGTCDCYEQSNKLTCIVSGTATSNLIGSAESTNPALKAIIATRIIAFLKDFILSFRADIKMACQLHVVANSCETTNELASDTDETIRSGQTIPQSTHSPNSLHFKREIFRIPNLFHFLCTQSNVKISLCKTAKRN